MRVLGISCYYHDSAASIIVDDEIIAAVQEERFTRIKHTPLFPLNSIKYCLEETGLSLKELDAVVFYDKPVLKFERLISTFYSVAPKGISLFLKSIPIWLNEKLFLRKLLFNNLKEIDPTIKKKKLNFFLLNIIFLMLQVHFIHPTLKKVLFLPLMVSVNGVQLQFVLEKIKILKS